ncbi:MAG: iron-containing alcohol dehydrogenase [Pseudomonadota bacterium]
MAFEFRTVPTIHVEMHGASKIASLLTDRFFERRRVFLVTDQVLLDLGVIDDAIADLESNGFDVCVYSDVVPDPSDDVIRSAALRAKQFAANVVIGIGGGSSMDTAKLVAVLANSDQALETMYGVNAVTGARLPLALVPTTAGTGSEVTPISVVTVGETTKMGVSSPVLYPDIAILDASLTLGLPASTTAATGIDAMVHAIEAYTSRLKKNPISDQLACMALKALHANIERVCTDGNDTEAREAMLLASMQAGQAFANAPVAAVHALAYPLGATFHVAHGLSNSLVLPSVLAYNCDVASDAYAELAGVIGLPTSAAAFVDELVRVAESTGIERQLGQVGVAEDDLPQLAADAIKIERLLVNNPKEMTYDAALACYQAVL